MWLFSVPVLAFRADQKNNPNLMTNFVFTLDVTYHVEVVQTLKVYRLIIDGEIIEESFLGPAGVFDSVGFYLASDFDEAFTSEYGQLSNFVIDSFACE